MLKDRSSQIIGVILLAIVLMAAVIVAYFYPIGPRETARVDQGFYTNVTVTYGYPFVSRTAFRQEVEYAAQNKPQETTNTDSYGAATLNLLFYTVPLLFGTFAGIKSVRK